jgi:hypothetical protein
MGKMVVATHPQARAFSSIDDFKRIKSETCKIIL